MPRRRHNLEQPALPEQAAPTPVPPAPPAPAVTQDIPSLVEYQVGNIGWRVERFDLLAAEFSVSPDDAAIFQALVATFPRQWLIVRRLFGVMPIIPAANTPEEDLRAWPRAELCEQLGLAPEELQAELDAVRALWNTTRQEQATPAATAAAAEHASELNFGDDLLRKFDFSETIFEAESYDARNKTYGTRSADENRAERAWFVSRVTEWRKLLSEPMAGTVAHNALLNSLYLRRMANDMARVMPSSPRFQEMLKAKAELEEIYEKQLRQLDEICPYSGAISGKLSFQGVISEVLDAYHAFKADGNNALADKIYTASEIEILCRMSEQMPVPRYRMGQNLFIIEAMHGLHDPNYVTAFNPRTLRMMDEAWKRALVSIREERDEPLIDLTKDDPAHEFPELVPPPTDNL